jgi:hypothetical protein
MLARGVHREYINANNNAVDWDGTRGRWAFSNITEENDMKKLLATVVLLSVIVAPAFGQSVNADNGVRIRTHEKTRAYGGDYRERASTRSDYDAYAYEPAPRSSDFNQPSCAGDLGYGRADYSSC